MSGEAPEPASEAPGDVAEEASGLIAAARAWLAEWGEEGIADYERRAAPMPEPTDQATSPAPADAPAASTPTEARASERDGPTRPPDSRPLAEAPTPGVAESVPWAGRRPTLEEVREHLGPCTRCGLAAGRQSVVFGDGNPNADLLFIGEGPGEQEDRRGLPFVGRAGDLLTQMIEKGIGIPRSDVYICNIVKCRPPGNRNPLPPEVSACRPFLEGQIAAIAPKVIVTLGKPAASLLLGRDVAITRVRGTWQSFQGIPLMPTLHPAYVLRQYTPENRRAVWEDLKAAAERCR